MSTNRKAMRANELARLDGFTAALKGEPDAVNPHQPGSAVWRAYMRGWDDGRTVYLQQQAGDRVEAKSTEAVAVAGWFVFMLILPLLGWLASLFW